MSASSLLKNPSPGTGLDNSFYHLDWQRRSCAAGLQIRAACFSYIAPDKRVPTAGGGRQGQVCQWHRGKPGFGDHAEGETQSCWPLITAGEDKAYETADHIAQLRAIGVTLHVTQNQAVAKKSPILRSAF